MGLGKPRTKLGSWMDDRGIKQSWLEEKSGYSKNTVTSLCNNSDYMPNLQTIQGVVKALKDVDSSVRASQFWDI